MFASEGVLEYRWLDVLHLSLPRMGQRMMGSRATLLDGVHWHDVGDQLFLGRLECLLSVSL